MAARQLHLLQEQRQSHSVLALNIFKNLSTQTAICGTSIRLALVLLKVQTCGAICLDLSGKKHQFSLSCSPLIRSYMAKKILNLSQLMFNNFKKLTKILHLNKGKFDATAFVLFHQKQGQYDKTSSYYKKLQAVKITLNSCRKK